MVHTAEKVKEGGFTASAGSEDDGEGMKWKLERNILEGFDFFLSPLIYPG